eukprot:s126_g28.t1
MHWPGAVSSLQDLLPHCPEEASHSKSVSKQKKKALRQRPALTATWMRSQRWSIMLCRTALPGSETAGLCDGRADRLSSLSLCGTQGRSEPKPKA